MRITSIIYIPPECVWSRCRRRCRPLLLAAVAIVVIANTTSLLHGSITAKLSVLYPSFSKKTPSEPLFSSAMSLYAAPPG